MKILVTVIVTLISVVLLVRLVNQASDENRSYITFSAKKLEKILNENKIDRFEISAYLIAIDSDGNNIKIDLSDDASINEAKVGQLESPGIKEKFDIHARALLAIKRCTSTSDIDIHPKIPIPAGATECYKPGNIGNIVIGGVWIPAHCHCFDPWY